MGVLAVKEGPAQFEPLADLCVAGEVGIHIDRTFGLDDVPDALAYVGEGHASARSSSPSTHRTPPAHRSPQRRDREF